MKIATKLQKCNFEQNLREMAAANRFSLDKFLQFFDKR